LPEDLQDFRRPAIHGAYGSGLERAGYKLRHARKLKLEDGSIRA
jgi:hypothetical protein